MKRLLALVLTLCLVIGTVGHSPFANATVYGPDAELPKGLADVTYTAVFNTQTKITVTAKDTGKTFGKGDPELTVTIENMPTEYTVSLDEMLKAAFMGAPIANLSVRLPGTLRPFGREAKSANYKASAGTDVIRFTVSREEGEDVGEYAIKASGEATQGNYTVTFVDGKLTITNAGGDVPSPKTADTMPIALLAALLLAAFTPAALAAKKRRESAE